MTKLSNVVLSRPGGAATSVLLLAVWTAWFLSFNGWHLVPVTILLATVMLVVWLCVAYLRQAKVALRVRDYGDGALAERNTVATQARETTLLELARKLIETGHLNVPERSSLPDGQMPFSALVSAAGDVLREFKWLPRNSRADGSFHDVVIEMRSDGYWLHEQHEIGVERFSPVKSQRVASLEEAVRCRVRSLGNDIDGVPVDWRS